MNKNPSKKPLGNQTIRHSILLKDHAWDEFLTSAPFGEFQQASFWAAYKAADGWQCHRTTVANNGQIIGGFQLLWRKTRFGRIGYVSKGPVAAVEAADTKRTLVDLLVKTARKLSLRAMIVQPPGPENSWLNYFPTKPFFPDILMNIITATLRVDVSKGISQVEAQMRRTTRQQIRKAQRAGVEVRTGEEKDISTFFSLMLESCKRQKSSPNPSSEKGLLKLWQVAHEAGMGCRLTFAEYKGKKVAGLLCLPFGNMMTLWKKGSLPDFFHLHPMEILYHDALSWAHAKGYRSCDFGALNRYIAEALSSGLPIPVDHQKGRDIFNLGFGGKPALFSESYIHFPNKFVNQTYGFFVKFPLLKLQIKKACNQLMNRSYKTPSEK